MTTPRLRNLNWPDFTTFTDRPPIHSAEYEARSRRAYERAGTDWLLVYGDREHWGNVGFLTGFDPRFEECLLALGPAGQRALIVGNEGLIHCQASVLPVDVALCQTFSLMGQPRDKAPRLTTVLKSTGMEAGQSVAIAGWKYLQRDETEKPTRPAFVPALVVDSAAQVAGADPVDATRVLMDPAGGLRSTISAAQVASWEFAAVRAAQAVFSIIAATAPGVTEYEAVSAMRFSGDPLSAHVMFASSQGKLNGLRSPTAKPVCLRDAVTTAVGYWGGLTCRAGLLVQEDQTFLETIAYPYFRAISAWYSILRLGVTGGEVWATIDEVLEPVPFRPLVNPGHLIGHEEWTHTPIRPGSPDRLVTGMALQSDIIPAPLPDGRAVNAEDTVVLADPKLRDELTADFPEMWQRIQDRRRFMIEEIGIAIGDEVLPLSPTCGYLAPFWQAPRLACVNND